MSIKLAEAVVELGGDDTGLQRTLDGAARSVGQMGARLDRMGRSLNRRLTLPLLAAGGAAARMATTFESEMSKVVGLVGVAADQVDQWGRDVLRMAPRLGTAPAELARGLFFVTSAGFRGAAAMDVLETSARASAAGLGEVATIADAVTSAVNAYGQENLSAARAGDILTAAVREGKLEAESLAPVLGNLLPTASAMGVQFEQVAGMLALFSRTGAGAASGAVSLQALMMTLQKPTKGAQDALEGVGLSMAQLREAARGPGGLLHVMRELEQRFGDNEEALAQVFPNIRAFRGIMNALSQDAEVADGILSGVADSTGALDHAFQAAANTAGFRFKQALAQLQATGIQIGDRILPRLVRLATMFTNALASLSPQMLDTAVAGGALLAVLGPAVTALALLTKGFAFLLGLLNPVTLGLAAVAGAVWAVRTNWIGMGTAAAAAWDAVTSTGGAAMNVVGRIVRVVLNSVIGAFVFVGQVASIVWGEVGEGFKATFDFIRDWGGRVLGAVAKGLAWIGRLGKEAADGVRDAFEEAAEGAEEDAPTLWSRVAAAGLEAFGRDYVGEFVSVVTDAIQRARAVIASAIGRLRGLGGASAEVARELEGAENALANLDFEFAETGREGVRWFSEVGRAVDYVAGAFTDTLASALAQGELRFKQFAQSVIAELARLALRFAAFKAITSMFDISAGGFLGSTLLGFALPERHSGGPVTAGMAYNWKPGEELFIPQTDGMVVPNHALEATGGGGSSAAAILAAAGPFPDVPMTPEAYAVSSWFRRALGAAIPDYRDRGGRV